MSSKKGQLEFFEVYRKSSVNEKTKTEEVETEDNKSVSGPVVKKENTKELQPQRIGQVTKRDVVRPGIPKTGTNVKLRQIRRPEPQFRQKTETKRPEPAKPEPVKPVPAKAVSSTAEMNSIGKNEVRLKQETIIIGAVAATFLSLACFFIGYKVGYNKGIFFDSSESNQVKNEKNIQSLNSVSTDSKNLSKFFDNKEIKNSGIADIKHTTDDLWTLRMISYKNSSTNLFKATNLAKAIKSMSGVNAFVAKTGNELIVCVGKFKNSKDQKLTELQIAMAELVYEDKKQFKGCYPVKLR